MSRVSTISKKVYRKCLCWSGAFTDRKYLDPNVPMPGQFDSMHYLTEIGDRKGIKILEIGSREVTGRSESRRKKFSNAEYVGFDYYPGPNVDVVGDAHKLSQYFIHKSFDIIYSFAVFEHLAMPWVVATEISKLLKLDGLIFIKTHFSFSSHERPWHFFQFSDMALRVLFSPALGFECIKACMSNPIIGRFSSLSDGPLKGMPVTGLYCHSEFLGRKIRDVGRFDWNDLVLKEVVGATKYPIPKCDTTSLSINKK